MANLKETNFQAKQEGGGTNTSRLSKYTSSSRQWGAFKNPRIVRVSRTFGGKDRHSKVCTIRGLRDRRIRLSVPTAIQLYDLQDRLGLSQPSKVVDWLLDATKHEIDKLPPLQIPPGSITRFHQPLFASQDSSSDPQASNNFSHFFNSTQAFKSPKDGIKINEQGDGNDQTAANRPKFWASDTGLRAKYKESERDQIVMEKEKWVISSNNQQLENLFSLSNQSSFPYNPYYHWEPSSLSLSQIGNHLHFASQNEDSQTNNNISSLLSSSSNSMANNIPSGSHHLYFGPPSAATIPTTASFLPSYTPYLTTTSLESTGDPRSQVNHFHLLGSSGTSQYVLQSSHQNISTSNTLMPTTLQLISSPMKSFTQNISPKEIRSRDEEDSQPNKGSTGR